MSETPNKLKKNLSFFSMISIACGAVIGGYTCFILHLQVQLYNSTGLSLWGNIYFFTKTNKKYIHKN